MKKPSISLLSATSLWEESGPGWGVEVDLAGEDVLELVLKINLL